MHCKDTHYFIKTKIRRTFFVLEYFRFIQLCDSRTVPGGKYLFVFTDNVYQVIVTLGMNLDVRQ